MIQIGSLTFTEDAAIKLGLQQPKEEKPIMLAGSGVSAQTENPFKQQSISEGTLVASSDRINAFDIIKTEGKKFLKEKYNASTDALEEFDNFMSRSDIYSSVKSAITAPERAFKGEFNPYSEQGIAEALNVAGIAVTGGIPGGGSGAGVVGIITGPKGAQKLGIEKAMNKAKAMHELGYSQNIIARKSAEHFSIQGNPKGIQSLFIGPDGQPRAVISNKTAKLKESPKVKVEQDRIKFDIDETGIPLKEILDFETLYELSPKMAEAKVVYNPWIDLMSPGNTLGYNPQTNTIQVGTYLYTPNRLKNDPAGNLVEGLLHEAGHGIQVEQGLLTGTADRVNDLLRTLLEARQKGSFKNKAELDQIEQTLLDIKIGKIKEEETEKILFDLYKSSYGEWEARAGSEYGETTFPMTYGTKTW